MQCPFWPISNTALNFLDLARDPGSSLFSVFIHKYPSQEIDPEIQNCLFKVKFDMKTNSNMQKSMVLSILTILD